MFAKTFISYKNKYTDISKWLVTANIILVLKSEQTFKITALLYPSQIPQLGKWYICYIHICNNNKCKRMLHSAANDVDFSAVLLVWPAGFGHIIRWTSSLEKVIKHATVATYDAAQPHRHLRSRLNSDININ